MTQNDDWLKSAYERFTHLLDSGFPKEDFDPICEALADFRNKHPSEECGGAIYANRVCAMLVVEMMDEWETAEWERK